MGAKVISVPDKFILQTIVEILHDSCAHNGKRPLKYDPDAAHFFMGYAIVVAKADPYEYMASKVFAAGARGHLPADSAQRKAIPIATAFMDFFPDAIVELARTAAVGSQQHHTGEPVQWDRSKSKDEPDALMRHFMDRGKIDKDGCRHTAKVAWRALAMLQKEIEGERNDG